MTSHAGSDRLGIQQRIGMRLIGVVAMAVILGACNPAADTGRLHAQASSALDRWETAVNAVDRPPSFVPVGELTQPLGTWELAVGENNKLAMLSAVYETEITLATDAPPDATIRWADGGLESVGVISASQALAEMLAESVQPCPECQPLRIIEAVLARHPWATSRGTLELPTWEFGLADTAVRIAHVAVADRVQVKPPPWDSGNPPIGISIDVASVQADDRRLTVDFIGGPAPGQGGCEVEYSTEAVESTTAAVIIVVERFAICSLFPRTAVGYFRTADVQLATPLEARAILEIKQGLPVSVRTSG